MPNEIVFLDMPWFVWIIAFVIILIPLLWRMGWNPISYIEDYLENKRLAEACRLGLTWEEYKKKHHIG